MTGDIAQVSAVLVAAGRGLRAGGDVPKQYGRLAGKAMIRHTVEALVRAGIKTIQPVIHPDDRELFDEAMAGGPEMLEPMAGGETRQSSVLNGLRALKRLSPDIVLIHDAARPFVDAALVGRVLAALRNYAAATPALPVVDTLRRSEDGEIAAETVVRDGLWRIQTPQGFHFEAILAAHEHLAATGDGAMTDDAAVAEAAGLSVALVAGNEANVKITSQSDRLRAEQILAMRRETRVGSGFDVHRFGDGDAVTLAGVTIPHNASLAGHSDADVAWHALTDALLGAIGAGDIGSHFPPSDPAYKGSSSSLFLTRAAGLIRERGGDIINIDVTIICEAPKIGPHRVAMITETARVLGIRDERVSIKATTTERLGFTGRNEGIAAQATATVSLFSG